MRVTLSSPNMPEMEAAGLQRAETHGRGAKRKAEGRCGMTAPSFPPQGRDEAMHPSGICARHFQGQVPARRQRGGLLGVQQVYVSVF